MRGTISAAIITSLLATVSVTRGDEALVARCKDAFSRDFPQTSASEVVAAPVSGLCEIHSGTNVLYYAPPRDENGRGLLVVGSIYSPDGDDLTEKERGVLISRAVSSLPLDQAIRIGDGPVKVIEFTDPDCPFCRRLAKFFEDRPDLAEKITRHVFLLPLKRPHPEAEAKARWILCRDDKAQALKEVMIEGILDRGAVSFPDGCSLPQTEEGLAAAARAAQTIGARATPVLIVGERVIEGLRPKVLERLIEEAYKASNRKTEEEVQSP